MGHDLIVIGGGAGGMAAARSGVRRGADTLLVQDGPIGGDCTFTGCVPSKTLIEAAGRGEPFDQAIQRVHAAVKQIAAAEDREVFGREGVHVIDGQARFRSAREIDVNGRRLRAHRFVLATGARPAVPPIPGLAALAYLTNENVFDLPALPESLAVLGGGAIGCELAQAFARLGSHVTLIEGLDRLLAKEEPQASQVITDVLTRDGVHVRVGQQVIEAGPAKTGGVRLTLSGGDTIEAGRVLVCVGRAPATDGLNLPAAGVATDDRGFIRTDEHLATTTQGIYAAGDVTGGLQFTHAADAMGRIAAGNACSRYYRWRRFDPSAIPWVTFTTPEVGRVGMTEAEAAAHGARVAYLPMRQVDRAITADQTDGFIKLLAGPRRVLGGLGGGRILGATVVAARGGEMIGEPALAMRTGMFTGRLAQTSHAYPTWSVAIQQTAAQFFLTTDGRSARPAHRQPAD